MEHTGRCAQNAPRSTSGPLMATDALGRTTPDRAAGVPAPRENRLVGLFYFLWLGECGKHKPYNISEIVAADPQAGYKPDSDVWGGVGTYHHWGEPFYGYYYSDDEWVVRHHMKLIMQADIDFLFFDTTNALMYEHNSKLVMRVLQEYHDEGWKNSAGHVLHQYRLRQDRAGNLREDLPPRLCPRHVVLPGRQAGHHRGGGGMLPRMPRVLQYQDVPMAQRAG
ncbi:MAG: hypothetical protein L6V84_01685 [Oscillospiraceae bacterium]|nr:MAG: hypothetical protein L6V84_01685 [Oscillospiraceae bacterium]